MKNVLLKNMTHREVIHFISEHIIHRFGDEGIPTSLPSSIDDIAGRIDVQHKPNDLGPITTARAKLLEQ
jgi:hypothetical protein